LFTLEELEKINKIKAVTSPKYLDYVKKLCKLLGKDNLVLSHNDLHSQNILLRKRDKKIIFIDFDFICYNYRSFDIANFFNEL